ncbi:MAG: BREX system ATP-binding domain-containing protein [Actinomycetes bacterium]
MNDELQKMDCWRALEALRSGVPNRDAVSVLGCSQNAAEQRFLEQLGQVAERRERGEQAGGTLLSGGFGSGKSHVLEYFQHLALSRNFVCSRIVVSKETPLSDPAKMLKAAVESAQVPGLNGAAVAEVAHQLDTGSPEYADFYLWANADYNGLGQTFPATLFIHERLKGDPELIEKVVGYWAGENLSVVEIRRALRECGGNLNYLIKTIPLKQLAKQRFLFLSRLFAAAGYAGWVILIDEVELIGRYSLLQRGRAYAELAKWMGQVETEMIPGLVTAAAITDDFDLAVLQQKHDSDYIVPKLRSKGTDEYLGVASRAETGMRTIRRDAIPLAAPNQHTLDQTYSRLKQIHATAYGWSPPDVETAELTTRRAMRSFVRRWINEWDIARLYPGQTAELEEEELQTTYTEDQDLELPTATEDVDPQGQQDSPGTYW